MNKNPYITEHLTNKTEKLTNDRGFISQQPLVRTFISSRKPDAST